VRQVRLFFVLLVWSLFPIRAGAQPVVNVTASVVADVLPTRSVVSELRARLLAERTVTAGRRIEINLAATVEGLLADRVGLVRDAIARPRDVSIELSGERADLRAGYARVVWGRLDELQPTDVVNPLDLAKFFLEGRSEARMAVALVRGRWFLPGSAVLEGILVPDFRPGSFDELDEPTSPFNLAADTVRDLRNAGIEVVVDRQEPPATFETLQGGVRLTATTRRLDWGLSAYRGYEGVGRLTPAAVSSVDPSVLLVAETFPRFTMIGGDFETVHGAWAVRGEAAVFAERSYQLDNALAVASGHGVEAGVAVERKAGDYRLSGTVLLQHQSAPGANRSDTSIVVSADRRFARETRVVQSFVVWTPADSSGFVRVIAALNLRDNVWLEGSGGWFAGEGRSPIARFGDRDFLYGKLKVYF
jgi:hypothetical protein